MKKQKKTWELDEASKHFINLTLIEKKQEIIEFRHRWKLGDNGLSDEKYFKEWTEKIERECQNLRREIRVSELEAYFEAPNALLAQPVLSSEVEGRLREENWGDSLGAVFALEIRALGSKLKFPAEWDRFFEYFLIINKQRFDLIFNHGIMISIRYRINEEYGFIGENVCLSLGANTGSEDLDGFWKQEIKPLLLNLPARIKNLKRKSRNAPILQELIERGAMKPGWQEKYIDHADNKENTETDKDLLFEALGEENVKEENGTKLGKVPQNIRYYRSKRRPL